MQANDDAWQCELVNQSVQSILMWRPILGFGLRRSFVMALIFFDEQIVLNMYL